MDSLEPILASVSIGLLATTSPCVLPLYPGFLAYIGGGQKGLGRSKGRYFLGVFVLAGVLLTMLAMGGLIALMSVSVGEALAIVIPIADLIIISLGVMLLLNINPFMQLPQIQIPLVSNPYVNAFVYGTLYGPIALPCSGPLVVGIFTYSLTAIEFGEKLGIFFWFGIGFGIPLLILSLLSGTAQQWITQQFATRSKLINSISGVLLVILGLYDLHLNWEFISLYASL